MVPTPAQGQSQNADNNKKAKGVGATLLSWAHTLPSVHTLGGTGSLYLMKISTEARGAGGGTQCGLAGALKWS